MRPVHLRLRRVSLPPFRLCAVALNEQFPPALAGKIRGQYRYIFKEVSVFDSSEIVGVMPGVLATSMVYAQHRAVTKGVTFLAKRPPVLVCRLVQRMIPCFANVREGGVEGTRNANNSRTVQSGEYGILCFSFNVPGCFGHCESRD